MFNRRHASKSSKCERLAHSAPLQTAQRHLSKGPQEDTKAAVLSRTAGLVEQINGGLDLVDILAARAAGARSGQLNVLGVDLHVHIVHLWHHRHLHAQAGHE